MNPLSRISTRLEASFWFLPAVIVVCSIAAAAALVEADAVLDWDLAAWSPRLFGAGADGSRAMLSAIATSMITVAGVVFSITIVTLSLSSTQYSPRVLRNFMRDRPTQAVLGLFVGIFAYCLVVLRTIRGGDEGAFIPSFAVLGGMAYAMVGIAVLIYFIHHVALSIQASTILARIGSETAAAIDDLYPDELGTPVADAQGMAATLPPAWTAVPARRSGYIVAVDGEALLALACRAGRVVRLESAIGAYLVEGRALASFEGLQAVDEGDLQAVHAAVQVGHQRSIHQDACFGVQQLADIALRALSPSLNDPTTACMCIDQLGTLLAQLARRHIPQPLRMTQGQLRLIAPAPDFAAWVAMALPPVLRHGTGELPVLQRMVEVLQLLAPLVRHHPERRHALRDVAADLQRALAGTHLRRIARPVLLQLREIDFGLPPPHRPV